MQKLFFIFNKQAKIIKTYRFDNVINYSTNLQNSFYGHIYTVIKMKIMTYFRLPCLSKTYIFVKKKIKAGIVQQANIRKIKQSSEIYLT